MCPVLKSIESKKEKLSLGYCSVPNQKTEKYPLIKLSFDLESVTFPHLIQPFFSLKVSDLKDSL